MCPSNEPIHITVPGCASDPRAGAPEIEGVVMHRCPALHPDDLTVVDGSWRPSLAMLLDVMDEFRA